ncbi:unnamed protein product [Rotaria magnacalcarata]|nr:unnamed protein product [Rotaria magnacalcarata]CAF1640656.1 unnamed protein product [Rotaria magnacalcarata]CAF1907440.1 unnamed protein product [Rotaria magnacalcarata]CAF3845379.1 unnamed protein product [Rotaria magnacalcarata]CAF3861460.1 unnamed protein product [Rotaria magnacalcarata]
MKNDRLNHLPPPPLFTIRPPPKPPGSLFENFQTIEILNGRCVRPSLNFLNISSSSATILHKNVESINWLNIFLLVLAVISVIFCIIIAIFIFICLKKLRKEEKQYKNCIMSTSLASRHHQQHHNIEACTRTSEHYKCIKNAFHCCDDYYSHQLIPMKDTSSNCMQKSNEILQSSTIENVIDDQYTVQNHQYECIPDYILTMTRHRHPPIVCHHSHQLYNQTNNICTIPYTGFSRSYLIPQAVATTNTSDSSQCTCSSIPLTTVPHEESSTPLLASMISNDSNKIRVTSSPESTMIGWTRRYPSSSTKRKSDEQQYSFLSQLRKSSIL